MRQSKETAMTTFLKLGPADHGRPVTVEELRSADTHGGYRYELIDGKLYVSPLPKLPHDRLLHWLYHAVDDYARLRPEVINYVTPTGCVIVPDRPGVTQPQPDLTAFQDFPLDQPMRSVQWEDLSPLLVVEILSEDTAKKDLERTMELYLGVPSIREYWILDPRVDPDNPTLTVYRRRGQRWQRPIEVPPGGIYTTRLLPGFTLQVLARSEP
jgi:Uma2 family endonuclease